MEEIKSNGIGAPTQDKKGQKPTQPTKQHKTTKTNKPWVTGKIGDIMAYLMCKDTPVFSIRIKQVLNKDLMPCPAAKFYEWRNSRLFLRGINRIPEEDERELGKDSLSVKRRLSLSDSYWIKYNKDTAKFSDITPYLNEFFEYGVSVSKNSAPSITLGGSNSKYWKRLEDGTTALYKIMRREWIDAEIKAIALAEKLKLPVNKVTKVSDTELMIHNFTDTEKMLLHFQPWNFNCSVSDNFGYYFDIVSEVFQEIGIMGDFYVKTILFDTIVGNYDRARNLSNWGYYKNSSTGVVSEWPLYDFNLAHPNQTHMFINQIKRQLTSPMKILLESWRSVVESFGIYSWVENLDILLNVTD